MTDTIVQPSAAAAAQAKPRFPRQIPFIIASEGCERFSFYGMRNILTVFLMTSLLLSVPESMREHDAKEVFHTFVIGVYFFPLLGGWLADRFFGKYNTVLGFSLIYCVGHALLAVFEDNRQGFYTGLFLIAFGSGGIKPLVASFMGDQFDRSNKSLAKIAFDAFYWIINFGSLFASLLMPVFLKNYGGSVAFGIPGILMGIATLLFWAARKQYVRVPPPPEDPDSFLRVVRTALFTGQPGETRMGLALAGAGVLAALFGLVKLWSGGVVPAICVAIVLVLGFGGYGAWMQLERAKRVHDAAAVDGVRAVLRILVIFALITPFWSLFDQKASTWVLQGNQMVKPEWFQPSQMQALNPLLVLLLIPFNNIVLFPLLRRMGLQITALRRMGAGIAFSGLAWIAVGMLQLTMDGGQPLSLLWQILPYVLLTMGEVLVSATGVEFAYSQAPASMKGTIMSFFYLSVTIGNVWVLLANNSVKSPAVTGHIAATGMSVTAFQMFFFAGFALLAALAFALYARSYKEVDNYRAT